MIGIELNIDDKYAYVTLNYRHIIENDWMDDLQYLCKPTEHNKKRICIKLITDRGVSHEIVRQRKMSFMQESSRFCNYSKGKFNNEITFIIPSWHYIKTGNYNGINRYDGDFFESALRYSERYYFKLLELGWTPQQARQVLPNALKTEIYICGFVDDWKHVFELRCSDAKSGKPHPDMSYLMDQVRDDFKNKSYI